MQELYDLVSGFFTDLYDSLALIVTQVFIDIIEFFMDFFYWVFDQLLSLVVSLVSILPFPDIPNFWAGAPPELLNMVGLIGLAECFAIIGSALIIRIFLQLIPFVRLGS